jgi:hypothetical protein
LDKDADNGSYNTDSKGDPTPGLGLVRGIDRALIISGGIFSIDLGRVYDRYDTKGQTTAKGG